MGAEVGLRVWACEQVGRDFEWGTTDCCSLVRTALSYVLGLGDPFPFLNYRSRSQALRAIRQTGGPRAVLERHGFTEFALCHARTGDVLIAGRSDPLANVGIVIGGKWLTSGPEDGVILRHLAEAEGAAYVMRHA